MKIYCMFSLESPHRSDSNEYIQHIPNRINNAFLDVRFLVGKFKQACKVQMCYMLVGWLFLV